MGKLAEELEASGMLEVSARLTSRIPIVMFVDSVSGIECDISMQVS
jgi:DNA polymerase sigma